jgi:hypothetical protein
MPRDQTVLDHLLVACSLAGDLECTRTTWIRFDSLVRATPHPGAEAAHMHREFAVAFAPPTADVVKSFADVDFVFEPQLIQGAFEARPEARKDFDALLTTLIGTSRGQRRSALGLFRIFDQFLRGQWSMIDSIIPVWARLGLPARGAALGWVRYRVIAEATGAMVPSATTADSARALVAQGDESAKTAGLWVAGLNGLLRGDSTAVREAMAALRADTSARASYVMRSLRGLSLGFGGNHAAAAESLYAIEGPDRGVPGRDEAASPLDRLIAARWLEDAHKPAMADSLLVFTNSSYFTRTSPPPYACILMLAQLERSRIAETLGRNKEAVRYAQRFVAMYDMPPPAHRPLVAEARERVARLTKTER